MPSRNEKSIQNDEYLSINLKNEESMHPARE